MTPSLSIHERADDAIGKCNLSKSPENVDDVVKSAIERA